MRRVLLAVVLLVAACGDDGGAATSGGGLTVSVARERLYEPQRAFELTLVNDGDQPVEVTDARLVSDLFDGSDAADAVTVWPTGDPTSVTLPYGAAVCDADDRAMALAAVVDGAPAELALGDAPAAILRVHAAECAAAQVAEAVAIGWGDTWERIGTGRIAGTVTVDQLGDATGEVVEIQASVVFAVKVGSPLPATDDVDVVVTAARCDAHALTESKKTFTFPLAVAVDDGARVRIELEAKDGPVRQALDRAIEECVAARTGH